MVAVAALALAISAAGLAPVGAAVAAPSSAAQGTGKNEQVALTDAAGKPTDKVTPQKFGDGKARTFSTGQLTGKNFSTVGLSWKKDSLMPPGTKASARFHKDGSWGRWRQIPLELEEAVNESAKRAGSPSHFSGSADGVEVKVTTPSGGLPKDLRLGMVDPKTPKASPGSSSPGRAQQPHVNSRADWGADESIADDGYKLQDRIKAAVVHHTVTGNNSYSRADVPRIINGIYEDLIKNQGYGDFPYHFVVDRFGAIWEGRKGSVEMRPGSAIPGILGGHAQGFNTDTFGVAALGNFEPNNSEGGENTGPDPQPTPAMCNSLVDLLGWKLDQYGLDPRGKVELISWGGGGTNPHPIDTPVTVDVITSHRDVNTTLCPGQRLYDFLPALRTQVGGQKPTPALDLSAKQNCDKGGVDITATNKGDAEQTFSVSGKDHTVASGGTKTVTVPVAQNGPYRIVVTLPGDQTQEFRGALDCQASGKPSAAPSDGSGGGAGPSPKPSVGPAPSPTSGKDTDGNLASTGANGLMAPLSAMAGLLVLGGGAALFLNRKRHKSAGD